MGMSDDLEAAVAAGSTMVRVGRGLFGERPSGGRHDEGAAVQRPWWRLPEGPASRHYAVTEQEKVCHPRS